MSDLPDGWDWATIDDIKAVEPRSLTDGPFGSNLASRHYTDSGARVIRLQNIGDGKFVDDEAYISLDQFDNLRAHEARENDLIIASLGNDLPKACQVPKLDYPAIVKADCIRLRTEPRLVDPKWVMYVLLAPQSKEFVANRMRGVGRPRLGLGNIRSIPVPLPPLAEQHRMVTTLEDHLSRLDQGTWSLQHAKSGLAKLTESYIDRELDAFPIAQLDKVASVRGGIQKTAKRRPTKNAYPFLRVANVARRSLDVSDIHKIEVFEGELVRYRINYGDLLVVEGNGSPAHIGRAAMWRSEIQDCVHQNHLIRITPGPDVRPGFLELAWNSKLVSRELAKVASSTSGLMTLNTSKVKQIQIPVPTLDEQDQLMRRWHEFCSHASRIGTHFDSIRRAEHLRRSLLREAFAGRLVPRDPDDEPASVVLERIRAERAGTTKIKKTRKQRTKDSRTAEAQRGKAIDPSTPPPETIGKGTQETLELDL